MFRFLPLLFALSLALVGCGGAAPMSPNGDGAVDADELVDAGSALDAAASPDTASGVDWNTASAASLQGAHIRRAIWAAGVYVYRMPSGALVRYVPGQGASAWGADATDRAATDWEILP